MDEQNTQTIPVVEDTPTVPQEVPPVETPQEVIHTEPVEHEHLFTKDLEGKVTCGFEGCTQLPIEETEAMTGEVMEVKAKHAGGRPSKYNEGMLMKAKDYYDLCSGKKDGKKRMPFIEELAMECGVNDDTIIEWTKIDENEEYSATIKNIKNLQKLRTVQQGYGAKNPTFAIFMLKANHGMMETEKRVLAGEKNAEPIQVSSVNYSEATKPGIDEGIRQQIIEEGVE